MSDPRNGTKYKRQARALLASKPSCVYCGKPADSADHVPALCTAPSPALWVGELVPACRSCNSSRGASEGNRRRNAARPSRQW